MPYESHDELLGKPTIELDRRSVPRKPLTWSVRVTIRVSEPGGGVAIIEASPHDVSAFGLGLWCDRYLYEGTPIELLPNGGGETLRGTIVRCGHLSDDLMVAGVKFDEPVDLSRFLRDYVESLVKSA